MDSQHTPCVVTGHNRFFSKVKKPPSKSKSLPTLELLSAFLALKCMPTIINNLTDRKISEVNVCVDAQVVMSWILLKNDKNKNNFAHYRVAENS